MERIELDSKQYLTGMCFGCGVDNHNGLHGNFYNTKDGRSIAVYQAGSAFQGYPERMHGGITAAMLDEAIGRAILAIEPDCWAVTAELSIRYLKPAPLNTPVKIISEVTENTRKLFRGSGRMILSDGEIVATATGTYIKQRLEKITSQGYGAPADPRFLQELDMEYIEINCKD